MPGSLVTDLVEMQMQRDTPAELDRNVEARNAWLRTAWLGDVRTLLPQMFVRFPTGNPPDRGEPDL